MHQILFKLGSFEIRVYGVMVALAYLTAITLASILAKKKSTDPDVILDLGLVIIISSVIGARVLYVAVWWQYYAGHVLEIFKVWEGGLVFYGGLIGAVLGGLWWVLAKKLDVWKIGDICMPFVALSHAIGRIGCYYNGCCYGDVNEQYGVIFPAIGDGKPHLPTQLYESVLNFLNFAVLMLYLTGKKRKDGDVLFLYFLNYGIIRFIIELFRGDPERGTILFLSTSMFISVFMVLMGVGGLVFLRLRKPKINS